MIRTSQRLLAFAAIPVLCLSVTASAQEKEVWACQQLEGAGLFWKNNTWEVNLLSPQPLLLTIDGANSKWKRGNSERIATCTERSAVDLELVYCLDNLIGTNNIVLNRNAGIAAYSSLLGGVTLPEDGNRDSPFVASYNCTKF